MTERPQDTSAEEPDGGNPHIRFRGGPGQGNQPGLLTTIEATGGNYFGDCPTCHKSNGYLNVGRSHYGVCDEHRVYWSIGSNLFSDWREESQELWDANEAKLSRYTEVEPFRDAPACEVLPSEITFPSSEPDEIPW